MAIVFGITGSLATWPRGLSPQWQGASSSGMTRSSSRPLLPPAPPCWRSAATWLTPGGLSSRRPSCCRAIALRHELQRLADGAAAPSCHAPRRWPPGLTRLPGAAAAQAATEYLQVRVGWLVRALTGAITWLAGWLGTVKIAHVLPGPLAPSKELVTAAAGWSRSRLVSRSASRALGGPASTPARRRSTDCLPTCLLRPLRRHGVSLAWAHEMGVLINPHAESACT